MGGTEMKYLCMVYVDEKNLNALSKSESANSTPRACASAMWKKAPMARGGCWKDANPGALIHATPK
jgi:hypothetical protein